jgi:hypothetical protein
MQTRSLYRFDGRIKTSASKAADTVLALAYSIAALKKGLMRLLAPLGFGSQQFSSLALAFLRLDSQPYQTE